MISAKSLRVDYEDVTAVCDLNLEIPTGQIYGLVGPNGAGKTSTLKALSGIIEPTYGEIKIGGFDLDLDPEKALAQLGFMPDFPPVYENLKVWEYLHVFATAYAIDRKDRIQLAREWTERVNLADKWDEFIRNLSRGMRQRLILAKTLLHDPKILLLDEPASGLDPMGRIDMRNILKEIAALGKTIIISSHILIELSDFCNAMGIMEKGRLVVSGTIEEIRARIGARGDLIIHLAETNDTIKAALLNILEQSSCVVDTKETKSGEFCAVFSGDKNAASILLNELIQKQIPVAQFFIKESNAEDIFFKIGAREVS